MSNVSRLKDTDPVDSGRISGQGMDRRVARTMPLRRKIAYGVALVAVVALVAWVTTQLLAGRSLSVLSERIIVSDVTTGTFEDFIPVRGRLVPQSTVYLDAIEGGRVEQILVEDGTTVEAGQPLVLLSNTNLQLEVLSREAAVTEQLNNLRTIELQLEQNRLSHKRNLVEIDYQVTRLGRAIERQRDLAARDLVSQSTLDDLADELHYYQARKAVTLESQATDARLQEAQLRQLRDANDQLEAGLAFARKNLDDLNIRAPVAGKLSGFNIEIGQSIAPGGRLGQIDDPEGFKLRVGIDEFYLGRVDLHLAGIAEHGNRDYRVVVSKIYPQVNNGQFEVDMAFEDEPRNLRRGQTLQVRLTLGDNSDAVLVPNGAFYQDTGGNWVFVVSADGTQAVKRTVRFGRRNTDFIEVLDGLEPGERIVTSPYTSYVGMDRLTINQ